MSKVDEITQAPHSMKFCKQNETAIAGGKITSTTMIRRTAAVVKNISTTHRFNDPLEISLKSGSGLNVLLFLYEKLLSPPTEFCVPLNQSP